MRADYSIVIPVYFNEDTLEYTERRVREEVFARYPSKKGEIVFVDDGSKDGSFDVLKKIHAKADGDVRVFRLSRNFGQFNATWCGLCQTGGPCVIMAADGQDSIEDVPVMLKKHFEDGVELVIGTREERHESFFKRSSANLVYSTIRKFGNKDMPEGGFDFFLIGKKAKDSLLTTYQPNTFFSVRVLDQGFSREFIPCRREERKGASKSRWTFSKKMTYMIDGVLGHSYVPIRAMSVIGFAFAALSFVASIVFFVAHFFDPHIVPGWTTLALLILFIGGIQMLMVGVLGEYLWRVLAQVRNSPPYIIETSLQGN